MHRKADKKIGKVLNNLKPGWKSPDGGWGWVIVVATGLSNVFTVSFCVCFGLVFRERLQQFGISPSQTTTIINVNSAAASFVGLINGPLFRKCTFRQVGWVAGFICSAALCIVAFMETFFGLLFFYSILYASCVGIVMSASGLTLISYFEKKRRVAVGLSWVFSGLGNIVIPQIATLLMSTYGSFGTIILFGGITLHSIICAVLLQPVQVHAKKCTEYENIKIVAKEQDKKSTDAVINGSKIIFPIEILRNQDKYHDRIEKPSCQSFGRHKNHEENEMKTPLMTCTNDNRQSDISSQKRKITMDMNEEAQVKITNTSDHSEHIENHTNNSYGIEHNNDEKKKCLLEKGSTKTYQDDEDQKRTKLSWRSHAFRSVVEFFDLDLLRDRVCVDRVIGTSLAFIIEINFVLLTPFILADYGLTDRQIAVIMSIGGAVDVLTRLTISVVTTRIRWENRTFLFIALGLSALSRAALAHVNMYSMIVCLVVICSMGKGMCLIFSSLVLPDYVSLEKLPAATGLQLLAKGVLFLAFGPIIGWLREISGSYAIPLHFLNIFSFCIIISGIIENWCCSSERHRPKQSKEARV